MDDCGSPGCHFLSGAQRTTRNVFGLLQLSWREELADTFVVVCRVEVINKKASRGPSRRNIRRSGGESPVARGDEVSRPWLHPCLLIKQRVGRLWKSPWALLSRRHRHQILFGSPASCEARCQRKLISLHYHRWPARGWNSRRGPSLSWHAGLSEFSSPQLNPTFRFFRPPGEAQHGIRQYLYVFHHFSIKLIYEKWALRLLN